MDVFSINLREFLEVANCKLSGLNKEENMLNYINDTMLFDMVTISFGIQTGDIPGNEVSDVCYSSIRSTCVGMTDDRLNHLVDSSSRLVYMLAEYLQGKHKDAMIVPMGVSEGVLTYRSRPVGDM